VICHAFTTERYLREVTLPAVETCLAEHGRKRTDFEVTGLPFIATGLTDQAQETARAQVRKQIAFYGSTPAYRGVLDLHGWGDLHGDLHRLSKLGRWDEMTTLIDDEMLAAFGIVGSPEDAARELHRRFGGLLDRLSLGFGNDAETASRLISAMKAPLAPQS
jgi:probable F420-dependent oxidoreductase